MCHCHLSSILLSYFCQYLFLVHGKQAPVSLMVCFALFSLFRWFDSFLFCFYLVTTKTDIYIGNQNVDINLPPKFYSFAIFCEFVCQTKRQRKAKRKHDFKGFIALFSVHCFCEKQICTNKTSETRSLIRSSSRGVVPVLCSACLAPSPNRVSLSTTVVSGM